MRLDDKKLEYIRGHNIDGEIVEIFFQESLKFIRAQLVSVVNQIFHIFLNLMF